MRLAIPSALLAIVAVASLAGAQGSDELIPFEKLDVPLRDELWKVTQRYTVRRKIDERAIHCSTGTYEWFLGHLPLASVAARELDLGKYVIEKKGDGKFSIDDTEGAFANCERAFEEKGRLVVVARGEVEPRPLPKVKGTGVIVIRWKQDPDDEHRTLTDCHIYFRVASETLHRASTPFRDPLSRFLGEKIEGFVDCAVRVGEASEKEPAKVEKALEHSKKLEDAQLESFKKKFLFR